MATNTNGGTTASLNNTPQAKDDIYYRDENFLGIAYFDVMLNDLGGKAKVLWSIDDGTGTPNDLIGQDLGRAESTLGDKSAHGANIWITSDGKIGYNAGSLSQGFKDDLQELAEGEKLTDSFTYAIRMSNGTLSWATVTIEYGGKNDAPTAYADVNGTDLIVESGLNPGNTAYAGDSSATGNVLANDVDFDNGAVLTVKDVNGSASNVGSVVTGTYGSVTINSDGSWTYNLDNGDADTQALAQGQIETEVFTYTVTDEFGATSSSTLTLTITGTNDGPEAVADSDTTSENAAITVDVLANDTDVDDGAVLTVTTASAPAGQGTASVVANQVHFDPGSDFDHLNVGDSEVVTVSYSISDEHGATSSSTLEITVTGTNDNASIAVDATVTDDRATVEAGGAANAVAGDPSASGKLTVSDADDGEAVFTAPALASLTGTYGTFTFVAATGAWTYTLNNALATTQALNAGDPASDSLTVYSADATASHTITVNITGANDVAVITGDDAKDIYEDAVPNVVSGTLSVTDVDDGESHFDAVAVGDLTGDYGTFTFNAGSGEWTYTLDNSNGDVNNLGTGAFLIDTLTVTSHDGTSKTITVTINGADDGFAEPVAYGGLDAVNDHDNDLGVGSSSNPLITGTNNGETINGRTGGSGADTINALAGNDIVNAGDGGDVVYGGADSDTIFGGSGNDNLYGQTGNDFLYGQDNNDELYGGSGDDYLDGGNNTDALLNGGSGNDTILGGANGDNIIGGYGADILTGGAGDDVFIYLSKLDTNDVITDFRAAGMGNDQLDLNGIDFNELVVGNQDFAWGGDDGPIANGLWFSYDAVTGDTTLYGDTNNNLAQAEFMVVLENFNGFNAYGTPGAPPPVGLIDG